MKISKGIIGPMLKTFLKLLFSFLLVAWLVRSGKIDFTLATKAFSSEGFWPYALLILLAQNALATLRWRYLLQRGTKSSLPFWDIFKYNWIGLFFNTFLPGAVSGDFVKLMYVKKNAPDISKSFLVISVLMDRIIGLVGLISLMGVMSVIFYQEVSSLSAVLTQFLHLNFALFIAAMGFVFALFLPQKLQVKITNLLDKIPLVGEMMSHLLRQTWQIGADRATIAKIYFLSMALQVGGVFAFWLITHPFYSAPLSLGLSFTFIPLGFMAISLPIAPAGLGVGHLAFEGLFSLVGIKNGASLFNIYFLAVILMNSLGLLFFATTKKDTKLAQTV